MSKSKGFTARRRFIGALAAASASLATPTVFAKSPASSNVSGSVRSLRFHNLHTGENLEADYWVEGHYQKDTLAEINRILRDHRQDEVHSMDLRLLDTVHALHSGLGSSKPVEIISGFRSSATNAMLRSKSNGVAKKSYHMKGMAMDLRVPGRDLDKLFRAAVRLKKGGVGYYGRSGFIHVDVGPVRSWGKA